MLFKKKRKVVKTPGTTALNRLKKFEREPFDEHSIVKLNNIIRLFLKAKYHLPLSLTGEEILEKIDAKRIKKAIKLDLANLIAQTYRKEYQTPSGITLEEIKELSKLTARTIQEIETGNKKRGRKETTNGKKKEEGPVEKVKIFDKDAKSSEHKAITKMLDSLSALGEDFTINWTNEEMRKLYKKIKVKYTKLDDGEKKEIYPRIMKLFHLETKQTPTS